MAPTTFATTFNHQHPGHCTVREWRALGRCGWEAYAKGYAKAFGESKALRANGSVVRFWWDDTKVRQRTYTRVHLSHDHGGSDA